jgi:hypothetical protein
MRDGLLLSLLMAVSMPAMAVYKCESEGRLTYTDIPCVGAQTELRLAPLPADAAAARQRAASERQQLASIEKNQEADRVNREREQRRRKQDKTTLMHKKKCALLGLEKTWSDEDAASGSRTTSEKTQGLKKTARRKAERYDVECGTGS